MTFLLFIGLIWAICLFHRREHKMFRSDVAALQGSPSKDCDWRQTGSDGKWIKIKRAFNPKTPADMARYALPVLFTAAILIGLQSWPFGIGYALIVAIKWFLVETVVDPETGYYKITLAERVLFEEPSR